MQTGNSNYLFDWEALASVPAELREGVEVLLDLYGEHGPQGLIIHKTHIRELVFKNEIRKSELRQERESAEAMSWAIETGLIYNEDNDDR